MRKLISSQTSFCFFGILFVLLFVTSCGPTTSTSIPASTPIIEPADEAGASPPQSGSPLVLPQETPITVDPPSGKGSDSDDGFKQNEGFDGNVLFVIDESPSLSAFEAYGCDKEDLRHRIPRFLVTLMKYLAPNANIQILPLIKSNDLPLIKEGDKSPRPTIPAKPADQLLDSDWDEVFNIPYPYPTSIGIPLGKTPPQSENLVADQFNLAPIQNNEDTVVILVGDGNFYSNPSSTADAGKEKRAADSYLQKINEDRRVKLFGLLVCPDPDPTGKDSDTLYRNNKAWWINAKEYRSIDDVFFIESQDMAGIQSLLTNLIDTLVGIGVLDPSVQSDGDERWIRKDHTRNDVVFSSTTSLISTHAIVFGEGKVNLNLVLGDGSTRDFKKDELNQNYYFTERIAADPLPGCEDHHWQIVTQNGIPLSDKVLVYHWQEAKPFEFSIDMEDPSPHIYGYQKGTEQSEWEKEQPLIIPMKIGVSDRNDPDWDKLNRCYELNTSLSWKINDEANASKVKNISPSLQSEIKVTEEGLYLQKTPSPKKELTFKADLRVKGKGIGLNGPIEITIPVKYVPFVSSIAQVGALNGSERVYDLEFYYINGAYTSAVPFFQFLSINGSSIPTIETNWGANNKTCSKIKAPCLYGEYDVEKIRITDPSDDQDPEVARNPHITKLHMIIKEEFFKKGLEKVNISFKGLSPDFGHFSFECILNGNEEKGCYLSTSETVLQ